jgi:hypothetical protein
MRKLSTITISVVLALQLFAQPAHAADRLPDLGMAQLSSIFVRTTADGRRQLRFDTLIVNVGSGAVEVRGTRADETVADISPVTQRIYDDGGSYRDVTTSADMYFAGDGHNHWHVRDLVVSELRRRDNGVKVGTGAKHGFCFFDNTAYRLSLPGAPSNVVYRSSGCGTSSSLSVTMGLSVGWGDVYRGTLADQHIDITGLSSGRYRLLATADQGGWFAESDEGNNLTWVDLRITGTKVKILAQGPSV